jgi:glycine hydroxymethyltransferase
MLRRTLRLRAAPKSLAGNRSLAEADPEMRALLDQELRRQAHGLELIASENFTSRAVLECLGSVFTNKYAEGLPGARYYAGTGVVDQVENLCRSRALAAFRLDPTKWAVNVQPYSGSPANFAAYTALLNPHDRLMGLDLPSGGHLTHGFYTAQRKVSASSVYFESLPYRIGADGRVDYDELDALAGVFKPKLIIAGGSAYPWDWDYARFRAVCDKVGAKLMVDMAHISGLVAAQEHRDPFEFADVVTSTTHKTLRGARSGVIFCKAELADKVNTAVFPSLQGGPHINQIAGVATQLKEVCSPEWKAYAQQVKKNARALADDLMGRGYKLQGNGTENHLIMLDVRPLGLTGSKAEKCFEAAEITVNKNSLVGDKSAITPGGLRLGAPALTTRGFDEAAFRQVAAFIDRGLKISAKLNGKDTKLADFVAACKASPEVAALRAEVVAFSKTFPFPGVEQPFVA